MEIRHLEHFVAVAEEQHFTKAAERLHIAQSGLSASVRSLERELGTELFSRTTRRVELTDAGRALLVEARRALAATTAAREAVAAVRGLLRGTLAVGTEQCMGAVDPVGLLADFRIAHPGVDIRLVQAGSAQLIQQVHTGRLDLAFVAADGAPDGVTLSPVATEPMAVLCRADHPLASARAASWLALADQTFVEFHPGWGARQATDTAFAAAGVARQVAMEVNDVHTLLELVGRGMGIALVPKPVTRKEQARGLCVVPLAEPLRWQVALALPSTRRPSLAARELLLSVQRREAPATREALV